MPLLVAAQLTSVSTSPENECGGSAGEAFEPPDPLGRIFVPQVSQRDFIESYRDRAVVRCRTAHAATRPSNVPLGPPIFAGTSRVRSLRFEDRSRRSSGTDCLRRRLENSATTPRPCMLRRRRIREKVVRTDLKTRLSWLSAILPAFEALPRRTLLRTRRTLREKGFTERS